MVTTDGFTVSPLEFPGGNIGSLAIHGTVNDLAVAGARPVAMTVGCILEEGLAVAQLTRILVAMAEAAREADVRVIAGDTKVVAKGEGGGLYFTTTGFGVPTPGPDLAMTRIQPDDRIVVSGPLGDHGTTVLLAREGFGLHGDVHSDSASLIPVTQALMALPGLRFMRDPTRGGLATVAHDLAEGAGRGVRLFENRIPIRESVQQVCDILGYDPLYLASEGRVVAVVAREDAPKAVEIMRSHCLTEAAEIGRIEEQEGGGVVLETGIGGERRVEPLEEDPLPRIC
ncbi:MAG: hydrogenase expression/formation protein HypE [Magnetococcales bacterium]|nr:hydrogenase expression/formation protein HypE [Magnetococcales bacterium]